jgi:hypothetical protein
MKTPRLRAALALTLTTTLAGGCESVRPRRGVGLSLSLSLSLSRSRAAGANAAQAFDEGVRAYALGHYALALVAFDTALRIAPTPAAQYNVARTYDMLGEDAEAARGYVDFLRRFGPVAPPEQRREVDAALARLQPRVAWLVVRARGPVTVEGLAVEDRYGSVVVPVHPGPCVVRAGARRTVQVRARAGDVIGLDFTASDAVVAVSALPLSDLHGASVRSAL